MIRSVSTSRHWGMSSIFPSEEDVIRELMEKWDSCRSFPDLWRVSAGGVSVFYYNSSLVTWFYGLNLVRFRNTQYAGKILEII